MSGLAGLISLDGRQIDVKTISRMAEAAELLSFQMRRDWIRVQQDLRNLN